MSERILRLTPEEVAKLFVEGEMEVVSPHISERSIGKDPMVEKAKKLFGEDFLGADAIKTMEDKCKQAGLNVRFEVPNIQFPYSDIDLEKAKADEHKGKARMVVLRPEFMVVNNCRQPITLFNLGVLFENTNPFGNGKIFYSQDLYDDEPFAQEGLKARFALPTKEIVPGSLDEDWYKQINLMEAGESRREAVETVWDMILYYGATGKKILESNCDWTTAHSIYGGFVGIGGFDSGSMQKAYWNQSFRQRLGVCPSR